MMSAIDTNANMQNIYHKNETQTPTPKYSKPLTLLQAQASFQEADYSHDNPEPPAWKL
ncbi:MAG: hypothetical protein LBR56_02245 [Sporomusaceae bacterium]|jgi:hypothetical protein|nr:hypothetical protein [Sporomusaceae bacterium]